MATFLTTPRMNPALRARVERAVSHGRRARHHAARLGLPGTFAARERIRLAQVLPILAFVLVALLGTGTYLYGKQAVEEERAALLEAIAERRAGLPAGHEGFLGVVDHFIMEAASDAAAPDMVAPSLGAPGALDEWLRRPAVYVHGAAAELGDPRKLDDAAYASLKDAFLLCLLQAPASSSERDLLAKVRGVYFAGAKMDDDTASVRRLTEARVGLGVLGPAFEGEARRADELRALRKLRKDLDRAPIEMAKKAAAAELLIVVADAAAPPGSLEARVTLVDLKARTVLLRARPRVVREGRTPASAFHEAEVDGCALALAVRRGVEERK
ncbi:MAG: hypothetical protein IT372_28945 [Polyangiaceae bacterium]|nr:hypothetical protein [Polyangiaceae bacterium]